MLDVHAGSLLVTRRRTLPRRHPATPLGARPGWLTPFFFRRG